MGGYDQCGERVDPCRNEHHHDKVKDINASDSWEWRGWVGGGMPRRGWILAKNSMHRKSKPHCLLPDASSPCGDPLLGF